jgi:hypothetical protein
MANHVNTYVQLSNLNEDAIKFLNERFSFFGNEGFAKHGVHQVFTDVTPDSEGNVSNEVYFERVGAKWCYVEDFWTDQDSCGILLISAWDYPRNLVEWLVSNVNDISSESKVSVSYEDEMPNFYGCEVYVDGILQAESVSEDSEDIDYDLCEYSSEFKEAYEQLQELDEDNDAYQDLAEEIDELRNNLVWEMISDYQQRVFSAY